MADRRVGLRVGLGVVALVGVALLFQAGTRGEPDTTAPNAAPTPAASAPAPVPAEALAPSAPRPAATPLPPPGTPVADAIAALKPRADAGDSLAACGLAMELLRCTHLAEASEYITTDTRPLDVLLAERGQLDAADQYAEMEIRKIQLQQQCARIDPATLALAPRYLAAAAFAGEPEAMLRYATGAHHGVSGGSQFIRDPDFERWRREAPAMLLRAAQAGRRDAVHALGVAYRTDASPYMGLIPDDPVQGLAWGLLSSRLSGRPPAFDNDNPAVRAEAEALASRWHSRYFANAVGPDDLSSLMLQPLHLPTRSAQDERWCDPGRDGRGRAKL